MRKTLLLQIPGDQQADEVITLRKQLVNNNKNDYKIIFVPESIDVNEIAFKVIEGDACCEDPILIEEQKPW